MPKCYTCIAIYCHSKTTSSIHSIKMWTMAMKCVGISIGRNFTCDLKYRWDGRNLKSRQQHFWRCKGYSIAPGFVAQAYVPIHPIDTYSQAYLYNTSTVCMCTPDVMCSEPFLPWLVDSNILVCMQIFLAHYRPHVDTWFGTTFWSAVKQHCLH